jgi:hypothetical protein
MGLYQIKKLLQSKENNHQNQEKTYARYSLDKGLISRMYKVTQKLSTNEWAHELNR